MIQGRTTMTGTAPQLKAAERDSRGFTLIEVVIALAVFAIGILAMYSMQVSSINSNGGARKRTEAVSWATNQMEILRTTPYDSLANGQAAQGVYNLNWTVTDIDLDNDGVNDSKNISVNVNWQDRNRQRSTNLRHVRTGG
jgi:type IV pilus modification protein PilV